MLRTLTVLLVFAAAPARAQPAPPTHPGPPSPHVVTIGSAIVKLPPDRAWLLLSTDIRAPKPAEAQQQNAEAMTAVRQKLKAARVPDEAIRTVSFALGEDVDYVNGKRVSRGYRAVNTIEIRVDEIGRVGEILDAAVTGGATTVSDIRFDLKNRADAERQALRQAVADARARAEAAAAGANASLGAVLRVEEQARGGRPPVPMPMAMRAEAMDARPQTPITPGQIEIEATVTLTAALQ